MKNRSYTLIKVILSIILGVSLLIVGINIWVKGKLQNLLENIDQISYESFEVDIFRNNARLHQIHWKQVDFGRISHAYNIETLSVSGFHLWSFLIHKEIHVRSIDIKTPHLSLYRSDEESEVDENEDGTDNFKGEFPVVKIDQFELSGGKIRIIESDSTTMWFEGDIPSFQIHDILLDTSTISRTIPFQWSDMEFAIQMLSFKMSDLYHLNIESFHKSESHISLQNLEIVSPYDKYQFQNHLPYEKAWLNLMVPSIEITHPSLLTASDSLGFAASKLVLYQAGLDIYKDNRLPEYPHVKPLYSQLLRELPFYLTLDTVHIQDADIQFQLQTRKEPPPGMVSFKGINGFIAHLNNRGVEHPDFQRTTVHAVTNFMDKSRLELNWSFDISNTQDAFIVTGRLDQLTDKQINHFATPVLNIDTEGAIHHLAFNFAGNDDRALGDMFINYDALRINLLKKDGTSRRKWISAIINFVLSNKLDGPVEKKGLTIERVKNKSFWHFLWLMVQEGSLETIK